MSPLWKGVCMKHGNLSTQLAPLVPPACGVCGQDARLVGLEPASDGDDFADLCTYECNACSAVQTRIFVRTGGSTLIAALEKVESANGVDDRGAFDGRASIRFESSN
jgi:hypothetical protein